MVREKQKPAGQELVGRRVSQKAASFGRAWAEKNYPLNWRYAVVWGKVSNVRGNGTSARKPVLVEWENGDEEPMRFDQLEKILKPLDPDGLSKPASLIF